MSCETSTRAFCAALSADLAPGLGVAAADLQDLLLEIHELAATRAERRAAPDDTDQSALAKQQRLLARAEDQSARERTIEAFRAMRAQKIDVPAHGEPDPSLGFALPKLPAQHGWQAVWVTARALRRGDSLLQIAEECIAARHLPLGAGAIAPGVRLSALRCVAAEPLMIDLVNAPDDDLADDRRVERALEAAAREFVAREAASTPALRAAATAFTSTRAAWFRAPDDPQGQAEIRAAMRNFALALCEAAGVAKCIDCGRFVGDPSQHACPGGARLRGPRIAPAPQPHAYIDARLLAEPYERARSDRGKARTLAAAIALASRNGAPRLYALGLWLVDLNAPPEDVMRIAQAMPLGAPEYPTLLLRARIGGAAPPMPAPATAAVPPSPAAPPPTAGERALVEGWVETYLGCPTGKGDAQLRATTIGNARHYGPGALYALAQELWAFGESDAVLEEVAQATDPSTPQHAAIRDLIARPRPVPPAPPPHDPLPDPDLVGVVRVMNAPAVTGPDTLFGRFFGGAEQVQDAIARIFAAGRAGLLQNAPGVAGEEFTADDVRLAAALARRAKMPLGALPSSETRSGAAALRGYALVERAIQDLEHGGKLSYGLAGFVNRAVPRDALSEADQDTLNGLHAVAHFDGADRGMSMAALALRLRPGPPRDALLRQAVAQTLSATSARRRTTALAQIMDAQPSAELREEVLGQALNGRSVVKGVEVIQAMALRMDEPELALWAHRAHEAANDQLNHELRRMIRWQRNRLASGKARRCDTCEAIIPRFAGAHHCPGISDGEARARAAAALGGAS